MKKWSFFITCTAILNLCLINTTYANVPQGCSVAPSNESCNSVACQNGKSNTRWCLEQGYTCCVSSPSGVYAWKK